jgi:hypothetical protein
MKDFHLFTAMIGVGLALTILYLIRRDHLYLRQGLFWIVVAIISLALGLWPYLVDKVGALFGISYSPALLFVVAIAVLTVRSLQTDIALTRMRRDLRRLNQRIAYSDCLADDAHSRDKSDCDDDTQFDHKQ